MYCKIYEVSSKPIAESDWLEECELPEWFVGAVADFTRAMEGYERTEAIQEFISQFQDQCSFENDVLQFTGDVRDTFFKGSFQAFQDALAMLARADYAAFTGQKNDPEFKKAMMLLRVSYEDTYSDYIYVKESGDLICQDAWVRELDLSEPVYFGAVFDYHW